MNSFDVFDTLLARRFLTATPLFHQIERERGITDFAARRIEADRGAASLADIYRALDLPASVMDREIQLEFENAIPIRQNLLRVQHGDLLISDMYMSGSDILRMVRGVGLDKQVTIFRSSNGKSSGEVWRRLASRRPERHVGDNVHSDFRVPKSLGFQCELFEGAGLTKSETILMNLGMPMLACLTREIRLGGTDAKTSEFFHVAAQLNLPWLFFTCEMLRRRHASKLTFLGRDGQLLSRIFNCYVRPCHYLPFSRHVAYNQPAAALAYLKSHCPPDGVLVDISSTGATWQRLNAGTRIEAVIHSDLCWYTSARPVLPGGFTFLTSNSECGQTNELLEVFNCGDHGYLERLDVIADGLITARFAPMQLDEAMVGEIHGPVRMAESLAAVYRSRLSDELGRQPDAQLLALFATFAQEICAQSQLKPHLEAYFRSETAYRAMLTEAAS